MTSQSKSGIVTIFSHQSVEQTVQKVERLLQTKGIQLFALVDHSGEAEKADMHMRPTKLLIFGNPKAGTPLMIYGSQHRDRSSFEGPGLGGRRR